ncbi:hypothetical protein NVV93_15425 [Pseudomonas sp. LS44]|uniref:hypothetical protein n=1 Tax=Pseudomonas sp. LS44 TaxID=1357074 RepID=UPI00215B0E6F|nr:hypothetical protein [Pseudomonas sp. LS44]UVE16970.1 hypothetical protein NVV93_15425 [Pseudomonas sp. LS44]
MLHAHNQDPLYRIAHSDEQQALIDAFAINVQDCNWLTYCALGGHLHPELPEADLLTGISQLALYEQPD